MLFYKIRVQKGVKVMKFSEFIYKRIDLEETKKKIQEITEKLKHAQSVEEQVQAIYEMNDVKKEIATADSLVYIRYTINTKDEFYAKEREYNDHIGPMLEEEMQKYNKVLLASPFRKELEEKLTKRTKAVIVNSPNNPTGVVYSEATIQKLADILRRKQQEFGTDIYLISDEPYRELVYDGVEVPYLTKYYENTIVGYSFSKSLSLPGERIGYLVIPKEAADAEEIQAAANVATRILGYVNAPSFMQKVVARCLEAKADVPYYNRNREALYHALTEMGFHCIKPEGAFYLFVKSPIEDEKKFCEAAKKYHILIVPGSSFSCPGYVRIAYCVSYETILNSLDSFRKLAEEFHTK